MSSYSIVEGNYLRDILDQPQALEDTLAAPEAAPSLTSTAQHLRQGEFKRIVLTGMGSSFHGLHPLNLQLIRQGFTSFMVETSELVHYMPSLFDSETLVVAVSQSGQSAETMRLLAICCGKSFLLGITKIQEGGLAHRADLTVLTRAGREFTVSCKTYVATLLSLAWVGDVLCGMNPESSLQELQPAVPAVRR